MRGLILLAALAMPATLPAVPPLISDGAKSNGWHGAQCRSPVLNRGNRTDGRVDLRRLGDLSSGSLYLSVVRDVNGCHEPTIIRYGYGAGKDIQRSTTRTAHPK